MAPNTTTCAHLTLRDETWHPPRMPGTHCLFQMEVFAALLPHFGYNPALIMQNELIQRIEGGLEAIASLKDSIDDVASLIEAVTITLSNGGTIYTCGNGGSAAQASHLAEELIGRYRGNRASLKAVCLNSDPATLTCIANDFGFENVYSRQCEALLTEKDALVVLSTSGRSENIVNALKVAGRCGATTLGLLGNDGGRCLELCERVIVIPGADSAHIQEAHQVVIHLICESLEET